MKAIVLAAGYATRLRPLTETVAKPLLPLAGRPLLDHLCDRLAEVPEVDAVHVVTNQRFAASFERWAAQHRGRQPIHVHNDGTTSNEVRLGAIGDIMFTVERGRLHDDHLLVVAGDNLFDFHLTDFVRHWHSKGEASAIALYDCGDVELVKNYSVVELDSNSRLLSFIEKPKSPRGTLAGTATYIYHRAHVPQIRRYLDEGQSPDQPGHFIAWLHKRAPVYGYRFDGEWRDIGNHQELLEADNMLRERVGMPTRSAYSL